MPEKKRLETAQNLTADLVKKMKKNSSLKLIWGLHVATLAFFLGFTVVSPIISPFAILVGATPVIVGVLSSISSAVSIMGRPIFGSFSDRGRRFETLMIGSFLGGIAALIYVYSNNLWVFALARILHGLASASFMPASISTAIDFAPSAKIGETLGWRSTMIGVSQLVGPGMGGYIAELSDFSFTFFVTLVLSLLSLLIVYLCARTRRGLNKKLSFSSRESRELKGLFKIKFVGAMIVATINSISNSGIFTFLPAFYTSLGFGPGFYGLYASIQGGASILTRVASGRIADRKGPTPVASLGFILLSVSEILLNFFYLPPFSLISSAIRGIGWGLLLPSLQLLALRDLPSKIRGFGSAIYYMSVDLGFLIGPLLFGYIIEVSKDYLIFLRLVPLFTLAALVILQVINFIFRRQKTSGET